MNPSYRFLGGVACLAFAGCLSIDPPLPVRTFAFAAPPGPTAHASSADVDVKHVAEGIESRFAWTDPATGEHGFHEAWRYLGSPVDQLRGELAASGLPATSARLFVHALWEERGTEPRMRLAFRLEPEGGEPVDFDRTEAFAGEGPEPRIAALRALLAGARETVSGG